MSKVKRYRVGFSEDAGWSVSCASIANMDVVLANDYDALLQYGAHRPLCDVLSQMPMEPGKTYQAPDCFKEWRAKQKCTCGFDALTKDSAS